MNTFLRRIFLVSTQVLLLLTLFFTSSNAHPNFLSLEKSAISLNTSSNIQMNDALDATYPSTKDYVLNLESCTMFVVEANCSKNQLRDLEESIEKLGGTVKDTVSIGKSKFLSVETSPNDPCRWAILDNLWQNKLVKNIEPAVKVNASYIPNDPYWSNQWGPKKIEAPAAWDMWLGSSNVLVAIVDTGIDYTHPDLAAHYVPLGYDWVNNDTDPKDDYGHGTHCAGIVAAEINNNEGIAGLAQVNIMAEKVLSGAGWGWDSWVAQGIIHATDVGANIISLSLGSAFESDLLHDAIIYASEHNVLVIAAAGNTGSSGYFYPAAFEEVIAVSATDANDYRAGFSTYGRWVDVSAPGVSIYSTMPTYHVTMNDFGYTMTYSYMDGTSMACPHVSGVAALLWSRFPELKAPHVRWILEHTGDDLGRSGFDEYYGNGRINAKRALSIYEHDMGISEVRYDHRVNPGQTCSFNVTIGNFGRKNETSLRVRFYANESLKGEKLIPFIELFSCVTINFSLETTVTTYYQLKFEILQIPGETNLVNNIASCYLTVRFPTTLRVPADYPSIKSALNYSGEGDVILVAESERAEGQIDIFTNNITLSANGIVTLYGFSTYCIMNVEADFVVIEGFDFRNCSSYAVAIKGRGNILRNNYFINNGGCIRVSDSSECLITQNYLRTCSTPWHTELGVLIEFSWNNTFSRNRIISDSLDGGVKVISSSNNTISFNNFTGCIGFGFALQLTDSWNNFILSNRFIGNRFGIALTKSPFNVLRNNVMSDNWCNFAPHTGYLESKWFTGPSDVDTSNTVDGKPIYYWVNVSNRAIPSDAGCVVLVNCRNITAENLELKNNYYGILLINSSNILISKSNIKNNWNNWEFRSGGIYSDERCANITVTMCNITGNDHGIQLLGQNHNVSFNVIANNFDVGAIIPTNSIFYKNNVTGNQGGGVWLFGSFCVASFNNFISNLGPHIRVSGSNHTIFLNNLVENGKPFENIYNVNHDGLYFYNAVNCTIFANNIIGCDEYAVHLFGTNNKFFHNNFINNSQLVYGTAPNIWDDGYPSGGNYWSSYNGTDGNEDGIGDTSYNLTANNVDHYPLMAPYNENGPPQIYKLTINGKINSSPMEGFYDTTYPRPGTYFFMANSTARIDIHLGNNVFVDCYELDGVNVTSANPIMLMMNSNHNLTVFLVTLPPLNVTINPTTAKIKLKDSITFTSTVQGGKPPYEYLWFVNGREVWNATSSTFTFTPKKLGNFTIKLMVRYPFSEGWPLTFRESQTAIVTVFSIGDIDGDCDVDIFDVVKIASIYSSKLGDPRFNPDCDLDVDGAITIFDVVICTSHYGEKW